MRTFLCLPAACIACMLIAASTDDIATLKQANSDLRVENERLWQRVDTLEAILMELGLDPSAAQPLATMTSGQRVAVIEEIREFIPTKAMTDEVLNMRRRADHLEQLAKKKRRDAGGTDRRQEISEAIEHEREARLIRGQADRTEQSWEGHYWILGWDGVRDVMIRTKLPGERFPVTSSVGNHFTWNGEIVETALGHPKNADFVTYLGEEFALVRKRSTFADRPLGREPVWSDDIDRSEYPRIPD